MKTNQLIIRQGDCMLVKIVKLPEGLTEVPPKNGRIELLWGEVTTHCHAIEDWTDAKKVAGAAIKLAGRRARLLQAADGTRFLEVTAPVNLTHEEHTGHEIPVGLYEIPVQMEHTAEHMRQVQD